LVQAYHDVHDELERLDAVKKERAEKLRELDLARLDRATLALGRKIQAGDERAIMAMVRIMERRARLAGLDQAVEHKHEQVGEWSMRWKTRDEK
jgi:hypothetical protein